MVATRFSSFSPEMVMNTMSAWTVTPMRRKVIPKSLTVLAVASLSSRSSNLSTRAAMSADAAEPTRRPITAASTAAWTAAVPPDVS